jgi:hypothetical protein
LGQARIKKRQREAAARAADTPANLVAIPEPPQRVEHVRINYADVVQHNLERNPNFLALYWEMQDSFADREFGRKVCLHEAAHAVFMEKSGVPGIKFYGPAIVCDDARRKFVTIGALVEGGDTPNVKVDEHWILENAKHAAAGGVAVRKLLKADEAGDERDFERWIERCVDLPPHLRHLNPVELWEKGQEAASVELDNEQTRAQVLARTEEYLRLLYLI